MKKFRKFAKKFFVSAPRRLSPPITMQSEGGNFLSLGGGDDGDKRPAPPARAADGGIDASFHSPAWQEQYLKSLTETRLSYDEFKKREKEREGKLAAAAELAERETLAFRKELERDRKRRLAGGRLGVKSGKVKKEKIQGLASPSMVTTMAPNGYTPGLSDASRMERIGTANFVGPGGTVAPLLEAEYVTDATVSFRKHRWLENTNMSPESSGVSPLQHSNTPRSFSVSS